jgi:hypothetical protein
MDGRVFWVASGGGGGTALGAGAWGGAEVGEMLDGSSAIVLSVRLDSRKCGALRASLCLALDAMSVS